jgi:hypothetical protein
VSGITCSAVLIPALRWLGRPSATILTEKTMDVLYLLLHMSSTLALNV